MGLLAQKIRAKYPGVYDSLDDATLEIKVADKYPQYRSMVSAPLDPTKMGQPHIAPPPQAAEPPPPQPGLASKIADFMGQPIAPKVLPQPAMDALNATTQMGAAPRESTYQSIVGKNNLTPEQAQQAQFMAQHPETVTPRASALDFYKGALAKINPSTATAALTAPFGGGIAAAGNAVLGAEGAAQAMDPSRSTGERWMGGVSGLAGLAGAVPGLGAIKRLLTSAKQNYSGAASGVETALEAAARLGKESQAAHVPNMPQPGAGVPYGALPELPSKAAQKAIDIEKAAAEAQRKASGTLSHFATLDPAEAGKEAKVLGLAKSQQTLDDLARTAGEGRPSLSEEQVNYFKPEKVAKDTAKPNKAMADAEMNARVEAQIAQTNANTKPPLDTTPTEPPKVPTIDEVMFGPNPKPKVSAAQVKAAGIKTGVDRPEYFAPPVEPSAPVKPRMTAAQVTESGVPLVKPRIRVQAAGVETPTPNIERLSLSALKKERDALEAMPESMPDHPNHATWSKRYNVVDDLLTQKDPGFNDVPPRAVSAIPTQVRGNSFIIPPGIEPESKTVRAAIRPAKTHMDAMNPKTTPLGVSETLAPKPSTKTPAQDLAERLGTPLEAKIKTKSPRTEDILKDNPRFQALSKEERATRYKELGGVDAELRKSPLNQSPNTSGIDPSKLYSGVDPNILKSALKIPAVRAALGGTLGYNADEEHPYLGAGTGTALGLLGAPNKYGGMKAGLDNLTALRYEALLMGAPQISNIGGNAGGAAIAPILEALRGNVGGAKALAKSYMSPAIAKEWLQEFGQSWKANRPITRFGKEVKAVGPSGRTLQAVDTATKGTMAKGGLSPELAGHYTLSAEPSTETGKALTRLQSVIPGGQIISPFMRTAIKANEMAAATSPLRWLPGEGKNLRTMVPTQDYITKNGTKIPKAVFEALIASPAVLAAIAGGTGMKVPGEGVVGQVPASAALGPLALPYQTARQVRDYAKYGRSDITDAIEAFMNNVPLAGDIPREMRDPGKIISDIPSQFVPQISMMAGDKTVRETKGDQTGSAFTQMKDAAENAIKAKLPWERSSLPAKRTFLGNEKVRNWLGQYPNPDYDTDPLANRLSDAGLLRRSPNQSLGGLSPKAKLLKMSTDKSLAGRPGLQELVDAITPLGNTTTDPMQESRLGELRGKSVRKDITPIVDAKNFTGLSKEVQDILLELMVSNAHTKGTKAFKVERAVEAAKKAKQ